MYVHDLLCSTLWPGVFCAYTYMHFVAFVRRMNIFISALSGSASVQRHTHTTDWRHRDHPRNPAIMNPDNYRGRGTAINEMGGRTACMSVCPSVCLPRRPHLRYRQPSAAGLPTFRDIFVTETRTKTKIISIRSTNTRTKIFRLKKNEYEDETSAMQTNQTI